MAMNGSDPNTEQQQQANNQYMDETTALVKPTTTENLSQKTRDAIGEELSQRLLFEPGSILFYLSGSNQPELIQNASTIIVGRQRDLELPETPLDLTDHDAIDLGVSRRHAAVHITKKGYFVEDLKSTNGTWVNGDKLEAFARHVLRSGDRVRFGELATHVYFSEQIVETEKIFLEDTTLAEGGNISLTPDYLANEVTVYLQSLAELQHIINRAGKRSRQEVRLFNLHLDNRQSQVVVEVAHAGKAIRSTHEIIELTKKQLAEDIAGLRVTVAESADVTTTYEYCAAYVRTPDIFPKLIDTILQPIVEDISKDLNLGDEHAEDLKMACLPLVLSPLKLSEHVPA